MIEAVKTAAVRYVSTPRALWTTYLVARRVIRIAVPVAVIAVAIAHWVPAVGWFAGVAIAAAAAAILVWIALNLARWWSLGRARWGIFAPAARRERLRGIWLDAASDALDHDVFVFRVVNVSYVGPHGARGVVEHRDGTMQDTWFWHERPQKGRVYVARGSGATLGKLDRHRVMFVGDETTGPGILYPIPTAAWRHRTTRRVRFE
ncbi:hypothetical protein [Curtobacterium poinsettiae]|uniref:hypothetical protein n=1 Tax=Curtobacterium poinsettiae TaxID=159612 RepID=UPI001BDEF17B|nr:hypothetical protein [Curtobacterium flaccumfaciens]MBT1611882.1 hypothetical protein [Curtobacterium flaccumfaciens pv. poinsettiae]